MAAAPGSPAARPMPATARPSRRTCRSSRPGDAPTAARTASSRRRSTTARASVPEQPDRGDRQRKRREAGRGHDGQPPVGNRAGGVIRERAHLRRRQRRVQGPDEVADRRRQRQRIAGGPYHEVRHAGGRALPRNVHRARPRRVEPLVLHVGHDGDHRRILAPDLEGREIPRHRPADRVFVRTVDEPRRGLAQDHRGHRRKEVGGLEPAPLPQRSAQGREVAGRDRGERQGDGVGTRIRVVLRGDETDLQGRIGGGAACCPLRRPARPATPVSVRAARSRTPLRRPPRRTACRRASAGRSAPAAARNRFLRSEAVPRFGRADPRRPATRSTGRSGRPPATSAVSWWSVSRSPPYRGAVRNRRGPRRPRRKRRRTRRRPEESGRPPRAGPADRRRRRRHAAARRRPGPKTPAVPPGPARARGRIPPRRRRGPRPAPSGSLAPGCSPARSGRRTPDAERGIVR